MELTRKQEEGIKIALDRYKYGEKFTVISGYAGSGKSTLVKFLVSALSSYGIDPEEDICYTSYTGKAVQVLIDKGNHPAMTLHKMLYESKPTKDGTFIHIPKTEIDYKVIICDEVSMVPMKLAKLLLSHDVYVIFCGDPGQLPPVDKNEDNQLLLNPHIFLDEIMRQAQDSGIVRLSMLIREGRRIDGFQSGDALVLPKSALNKGMLEWGDIVLCATNQTRITLNNQMREMQGRTEPIEEGEKLICLRNQWETLSDKDNPLTNGVIGTLHDFFESEIRVPYMMRVSGNKIPIIIGNFISETGEDFGNIEMDKKCLTTGEPFLSPELKYRVGRKNPSLLPFEFTYGNTITTWKAQGSEWEKVVAIEERHPFSRIEHIQYLYTACTRASQKVVLIRKD